MTLILRTQPNPTLIYLMFMAVFGALWPTHFGLAEPSRSSPPSETQLQQVRTHIQRQELVEARQLLDALIRSSGRSAPTEAYLLMADVCYQALDLFCAFSAVETASTVASDTEKVLVHEVNQYLEQRFGELELRYDTYEPVHIESELPFLDEHLRTLYTAVATIVSKTFTEQELNDALLRYTGFVKRVDSDEGAAPLTLKMFLPAGTYRINGQPVQVGPDSVVQFSVTASKHRSLLGFSVGIGAGVLSTSFEAVHPKIQADLELRREKRGVRLRAGGTITDVSSAGPAHLYPHLQAELFRSIRLSPTFSLEPSLGYLHVFEAEHSGDCAAAGPDSQSSSLAGTCFDTISAPGLVALLRVEYHHHGKRKWGLAADIGGGITWPNARHGSWSQQNYAVANDDSGRKRITVQSGFSVQLGPFDKP